MQAYDVAFLGSYTKDTIVSAAGTRMVDGGGFNYGAHAAAQMGNHRGLPLRVLMGGETRLYIFPQNNFSFSSNNIPGNIH